MVGISWFHLGKHTRQPFHLFVNIEEAEEVTDLVKTVYTIAKKASDEDVLVDVSAFSSLVECMTPELEPLSTGALVFLKGLEEEDNEYDASGEQVQAIQGLVENTGAVGVPNMESRDLDRSIYFNAHENEQEPPLASSQTKILNS